jgi:DNA-binding MarR family transcriptional regulator
VTRWLTSDEQTSWRAYLDASRLLFDAIDRRLSQQSNLLHPYYEVMVRLSEAPDHTLRMSELAEHSRSSRSRISHAIARMEERGWVARFTSDDDRRGQWARLTDDGTKVLADAAPDHVETVRRVLVDPLTADEFAELGRISAKLRDAIVEGSVDFPSDS